MNGIILFDGVCNFCSGSMRFIIERDTKNYFKFASLQSEVGEKLLEKYNISKEETDSVVLIEDGRAYTFSTAVLKIAKQMDGAWSWFYAFIIVPKFVRDFFYRLFAKNRYNMFGKTESCMLPTPEIRERFLG